MRPGSSSTARTCTACGEWSYFRSVTRRALAAAGGVEVDLAAHALEVDRAEIGEGHRGALAGLDHGLADEDLPRARVLRDPRPYVHGLTVVVAFLEQDGTGMQADVRRWQAGLAQPVRRPALV